MEDTPESTVVAAGAEGTTPVMVPFEFRGTAGEYFRIWIVNALLTLVTFGLFLPWAKVRTERFFYAHTTFAGAPFEYTASPLGILRGRLVALFALLAYSGVSALVPAAQPFLTVGLILLTPWAIVRSLQFRAHHSVYRGLRFHFDGSIRRALWLYPVLGFLSLWTLGLLWPWVRHRQVEFSISHSSYGRSRFAYEQGAGGFYGAHLIVGLLVLVGLGALFVPVIGALLGPLVLYGAWALYSAWTANLVQGGAVLGRHRLHSNQRGRDLMWLYATNAVAVGLSLGMLIPWARVRLARYRAERLHLEVDGTLEEFLAVQADDVSATGSEVGDVFDFDLGLGV